MSKTEFIDIGTGEALRGRDWQLPVRQTPSTLTGKVVGADGTPVPRALILFRDVTYDPVPGKNEMEQFAQLLLNARAVETDDSGYFNIKGYVGQKYVMAAVSRRPDSAGPRRSEPEMPNPVRIVLAKASESVNIVIK
jgi:hypothetical protein